MRDNNIDNNALFTSTIGLKFEIQAYHQLRQGCRQKNFWGDNGKEIKK